MYNPFSFVTIKRPSNAVNSITTDLINGMVLVEYENGESYHYSDVSRRAIVNLLIQPNISLGFWVNDVLLASDTKCATYGSCEHLAWA